jgi:hypothetical protein
VQNLALTSHQKRVTVSVKVEINENLQLFSASSFVSVEYPSYRTFKLHLVRMDDLLKVQPLAKVS